MDPAGAPPLQETGGQGQAQGKLLVPCAAGGHHILQIEPGGAAGLVHQLQEAGKIFGFQSLHLQRDPAVVVKEVHGAQDGPVTGSGADLFQTGVEGVLVHLPQMLLAENGAHGLHFPGNRGILIRQIRMICAGIDDAEGVAAGGKVKVQRLHHGMGSIGKVDGHDAAHGGGHLVHQAAGLAEIVIFGILADLGDLNGGETAAVQTVDDRPQQDLKGGRGGEPAARQDPGSHIGVKAADRMAKLRDPGGHAANEAQRRAKFLGADLQLVQRYGAERIALRLDADHTLPIGSDGGQRVHADSAGQHPAQLMIRVVAAQLRTAGGGEEIARGAAKAGRKALLDRFVHKTALRDT